MLLINNITNEPLQKHTIVLPDGTEFSMTIYFVPMQLAWFILELEYVPTNFILRSFKLCNSFNLLNQFSNRIPFGLACRTVGDREPSLQEDFLSGNANLYLLTKQDCIDYEDFLSGTGD